MIEYSSTSKEFVRARVSAPSGINPTGDAVQMAFTQSAASPVSLDWNNADWDSSATFPTARCLIGPSGGVITLAPGVYQVWVKIFANTETPVKLAGAIKVV